MYKLKQLSAAKQRRLNVLMDKNNEGQLTSQELAEFDVLVRETEEIALHNAKALLSSSCD